MLLRCCVIHHDIIIFECIFHWFKLSIQMYPLDLEYCMIVYYECIVEYFI